MSMTRLFMISLCALFHIVVFFNLHLLRTRLKPTAIPHIFPNLPLYLSKKTFFRSTTASTSSARQELENARIESCNSNLFDCELFDLFASFRIKITNEILPSGYTAISTSNSMQFHYIACQENFHDTPKLLSSVVVTEDLIVKPFVLSTPLPSSSFCYIIARTKLSNTSQLLNILALCVSLSQMDSSINSKVFISTAINCFEMFLSTRLDENNLNQNEQFLLQFILEQLQLISISKTNRRYSVSMLKTCFLWQLTSTFLYEKLCNFLLLPSRSRLRQLSSPINVDSYTIYLNYLKARIAELTPKERVFVFLIDEVYTAQRIEYSDGSFISLTTEGKPAKLYLRL